TLALQRQVLARDLPLVASALADHLPRAPRVALLKGWQNYLCRHKVSGGYPEEPGTALFDLPDAGSAPDPLDDDDGPRDESAIKRLGREVLRLREWAEDTTTGDRDDLVPGVSARAWRQVSLTKMECLGTRCPLLAECFPERARA